MGPARLSARKGNPVAAPIQFKTIPDHDQIKEIERNLRFHPSTVQTPQALTREQVEAFNRDGFLKGCRVFSPEEMAEHRACFDALLARVLAAGGDSYSISTAHLKYGTVYDLLTHPRIVGYVRDL